jgi:hypothetical protein
LEKSVERASCGEKAMSVKWTKLGLAGAAIVVLAAGVFIYARSDRAHPADTRPVEPTPVIATNVQQHDVPIILTGLGTVTTVRHELPENGINDLERDTTVQCFAMNASTVSLNAWGFSNSSP